jgi:hypothetical protein
MTVGVLVPGLGKIRPTTMFPGRRTPKTWNEVSAISRDPGVISSVRRCQNASLEYTAEPERIVQDLANDPLPIEKAGNSDGMGLARLIPAASSSVRQATGID